MTKSERQGIYFHCFTAETQLCANCVYYYDHYLQDGWCLSSGHCVYPRHKLRHAWDTCGHFKNKREEVTTK